MTFYLTILKEYIHITSVAISGKSQIIKAISAYLKKKHSHDMSKISAFTKNASLLIGGSTIHSLINLSIDGNIIFCNLENKMKIV